MAKQMCPMERGEYAQWKEATVVKQKRRLWPSKGGKYGQGRETIKVKRGK